MTTEEAPPIYKLKIDQNKGRGWIRWQLFLLALIMTALAVGKTIGYLDISWLVVLSPVLSLLAMIFGVLTGILIVIIGTLGVIGMILLFLVPFVIIIIIGLVTLDKLIAI